MPGITLLTADLRSGEISPKAQGYPALPEYQRGCRKMEGALPIPTGGFRMIPGTYWHAYSYSSGATPARVIPFYGLTGQWTVELTATRARFLDQTGAIVQYSSADFVLNLPYNAAEVWELRYQNINGELYLVHDNYAPRKIAENTPAPFAISTPTFTGGRTWASANNYPSVIWSHAGRLGLGCTKTEPTLYAMSRAPDSASGTYRLTDFTTGANPDDAILGFANDGYGSKIRWLVSNRRVAAGLEKTTWMDAGGLPTAANFYITPIGYKGAARVQAVASESAIVYVGAPTPTLHMMVYSQEGGGLVDIDLTRYADHILLPGVVELAVMSSPFNCVWAVRTDGELVACTIDTTPGGMTWGFGRRVFSGGGLVKSACVVRGTDTDRLWLVVYRNSKYHHEHIEFTQTDTDFTELHYIDAGLRLAPGTPTTTFSGLGHLEGKVVHAIGDGGSMPERTVASGAITYEGAGVSKLHVGLPMHAEITPTRPELQANATWQGKKKQVEKVILRVHESYAGKVGADADNLEVIPYTGREEQPLGYPPAPITDDLDVTIAGNIGRDGTVTIVQDEPFPLTVLAIITRIKLLEA